MPQEKLEIRVDEKGAIVASRNIDSVGKSAKATGGALKLLKRALGALAALLVVRQLITLADTFTVIQNKLKIVTTGTENLAAVTDELFQIAKRTRSSFEATSDSFSKFALAAKNAGRSQEEMLRFTELVNKAVIIGGSSAQEAAGGLRQLSQGIASGALRGDELISVLENLPFVADTIATSLGITRGELRDLGKQGKISADVVFDAFRDQASFLETEFAKTSSTVGQALTLLGNSFLRLIGDFDQGRGITAALAKAIGALADKLDQMKPAIDFIGNVFTATFNVLRPLVAGVVDKFNEWGVTGESLKETFFDIGIALVAILRTAAQVIDGIISGFRVVSRVYNTIMKGMQHEGRRFVLAWEELHRNAFNAIIRGINKVRVALGQDPIGFILPDPDRVVPEAFNWGAEIGNAIKEGTISPLTGLLDAIIAQVDDATLKAKLEALKPKKGEIITEAPETGAKPVAVELGATEQLIADLKTEGELLQFNNEQRAREAQLLELKAELAKTGQELSPEKEEEIRALQATNAELELQAQLLEEITGPAERFAASIAALNKLEEDGKITAEELRLKTAELKEEFEKGPASTHGRGEEVLSSIFDNGLSALNDLDSKWSDFVLGFLSDIARMLQQQVLLNLATKAAGLGIPGFQHGTQFTVGGRGGIDNNPIAFNASRGERITVETPAQQRQATMPSVAAPMVNLKIVNVQDREMVKEVMSSSDGGEIILNTVTSNGDVVRQGIA